MMMMMMIDLTFKFSLKNLYGVEKYQITDISERNNIREILDSTYNKFL